MGGEREGHRKGGGGREEGKKERDKVTGKNVMRRTEKMCN